MSLVEVKLLGPLEVLVDGRPIEVRRPKQRALLALLALRAGEVVSTDRLIEELWGERPPKAAVGSLQNLVSELRKLIGSELLVTRAPGYVLELDRKRVDAHTFEHAVRDGQGLREALGLWRGPALADLAYEPFAQSEIARLDELRAVATEELFAVELEQGRHAQLVPELEAFVAAHPLRERPRGQLMLALYRSGRQADALEAYRQARTALVEELGIEPSTELQQLEQAILRHDPKVDLRSAMRAPPETDRRRTVTVLFADIVDSTELSAQLDPEVLRSVMTRYFDAVRTIVERHGGVVEKFIGDAAMAVFGVPTLHEDDAFRAVRAASELRRSLRALNADLGAEHGIALQLRLGLNTGEVLASAPGSGESFATGKVVNIAMRLQQAALPGEILLGEATHRLARDAVDAETVEPLDLRGLGQIRAFRLLEVGDGVRPLGTAALIGRANELAWLQAAFAGVRAERRSQVVTVLGDAGVGKSRLASELVSGLAHDESALVGRCVSYGEGATFLPLVEIVRQVAPTRPRQTVASLLRGDDQAHLIAERVTQLAGDADSVASTGEIFWAVRRFFEALARQRPLAIVLEDVHWAEPTLLEFVEYLTAWSTEAPLLVVCLARPQLLEQRPGWAAPERTLRIGPLELEEAQTLVEELAGEALTDEVRAKIVEVGEGNPLFLEQLLAFADEAGTEALALVPPTVEALLAGRLERLEPEERVLLERAAVAGREFARAAVVHLSPPEELAGLDTRLGTLARRGLVELDGDTFRFHHALIRDVTYGGVTKKARAELHERFGTWLEQREEGVEEIVGFHLEQAHRFRRELHPADPSLAQLARRAGDQLTTAGLRAWKRADSRAAVGLLRRAVALLEDGPGRAELLCELGIAERAVDFRVAETTLADAVASAEQGGDRRVALFARLELAHLRLFTDRAADPAELVELAQAAIPLFEELGDDRALARSWRHIGYVRGSLEGNCAEWAAAAERSLGHYRRAGWSAAGCFFETAAAVFHGPMPVAEGIARCEQLLQETTDRLGAANVRVYLGGLHALAERYDEALALLSEADAIYEELGEVYARADHSGRVRGAVHMLAGEPELAEAGLRESCTVVDRHNDEPALSTIAAAVGEALYCQDRHDEARDWSRLARERAPEADKISQVCWRSLEAKLLARDGLGQAAERMAGEALALIETTDALSQRGNVLLDTGIVLASTGHPAEAAGRIERAIGLFEAKENVASSRLAQSRLAAVAVG